FSSRRRHTRFSRDWSSDVCSSDLSKILMVESRFLDNDCTEKTIASVELYTLIELPNFSSSRLISSLLLSLVSSFIIEAKRLLRQIGRASCRERVEIWGEVGAQNSK